MILPSVKTLCKLINSNHSSIVKSINDKTLFRGGWYFRNLPLNIEDKPLINDWSSKEGNVLILEIQNSSHIKKAIFVYKSENMEFIKKYTRSERIKYKPRYYKKICFI